MPGRGKASRGKGNGAPTSSTFESRKRKAEEQAEKNKEQEHEDNYEEGDEGEDDKEVTIRQWKTPGESDWDDTPPTSLSTPDQLAVVVPLGTKQKIWAGGFVNMANFLPKIDEDSQVKLELVNGQLVKKLNTRKITNKDDWSSAFIRYMAVYCDKNPAKIVAVCHYFDTVNTISIVGRRKPRKGLGPY